MKWLLITTIILFSSILSFAQQTKIRVNKRISNMSPVQKSNIATQGLTLLSTEKNGTVFVTGFNSVINKNRVISYSLLWKISGNETTLFKLPFLTRVDGMFWIDELTGWVTGFGYGTFKTENGGDTWTKIRDSNNVLKDMFFLDRDVGWSFGQKNILSQFNNGDITDINFSLGGTYVKKLQFTTLDQGWLLQVTDTKGMLMNSNDGGKNWNEVEIDESSPRNFSFTSQNDGFVITGDGIYSTNNGGNAWKQLKKTDPNWYGKLFFLNKDRGWIVGDEICSTNTSGINWECSHLSKLIIDEDIINFIFIDSKKGWLLTTNSLYHTEDAGKTWRRKTLPFDN